MKRLTLERQSRILAWLIGLVLFVLAFGIAIELFAVARGRLDALHHLIWRMPVILYLFAVFSVWRTTLAIGRGEARELLAARLLTQVGLWLFLGGIAAVFVTPLVLRIAFGARSFAHYDVAAITLGAIGAALMLVANLLRDAARMRRELDEIV
jgi:hypothetical protein